MRSKVVVVVGIFFVASMSWATTSKPFAVSPGSPTGAVIGDACPTFSWGALAGATGYELVVYRVGEEGAGTRPVLRKTFRGSVSGWTPSLDRCLEPGRRYAWSVRAVGGKATSDWSSPSLFQVSHGPSEADFEEAVAVVRQYLVAQGGPGAEPVAEAGIEVDAQSRRDASGALPTPATVGTTQLTVDGGVVATSFTGDGSTLTDLEPANLSAGTAGIDITGTATPSGAAGGELAGTYPDPTVVEAIARDVEVTAAVVAHGGSGDHDSRYYTETEMQASGSASVHWDNLTSLPTTAKGDLLVEDGAEVVALPVGTDGQVLLVDSTQPTGLKWVDVGSGGPPFPAPVPRTGQVTTDADFDDGYLRKGVPWPDPRFTDNLDGSVTDNLTGLIWLKDANCFDLRSWISALSDANGLASGHDCTTDGDGLANLTDGSVAGDWRLANVRELLSLIDYAQDGPALPAAHPFSGVVATDYWSSTAFAAASGVWIVGLYTGGPSIESGGTQHFVWPVRGGQ